MASLAASCSQTPAGLRDGSPPKASQEVLAERKAKLGPDHPDTLASMSSLASSYDDAGQGDEGPLQAHAVLAGERREAPAPTTPTRSRA